MESIYQNIIFNKAVARTKGTVGPKTLNISSDLRKKLVKHRKK